MAAPNWGFSVFPVFDKIESVVKVFGVYWYIPKTLNPVYNTCRQLTNAQLCTISIEIYRCKQCPKAVGWSNCLPHHTQVHIPNDPLKCQQCPGTFFNLSCINGHVPARGLRNLESAAGQGFGRCSASSLSQHFVANSASSAQ